MPLEREKRRQDDAGLGNERDIPQQEVGSMAGSKSRQGPLLRVKGEYPARW
jgi:hypothetical protein